MVLHCSSYCFDLHNLIQFQSNLSNNKLYEFLKYIPNFIFMLFNIFRSLGLNCKNDGSVEKYGIENVVHIILGATINSWFASLKKSKNMKIFKISSVNSTYCNIKVHFKPNSANFSKIYPKIKKKQYLLVTLFFVYLFIELK
ncbi:hypothetical protein BpHYR1_000013 [Brachionus plicatilis]|uniref:Uncharacterized protein n=1 Tax=Brachionus plicatilis TaxID=10195 RepID=A0A3M7RXC9_BRAPC|nr:hypothetical protein BpHYR1_000013 [Brachionus plicatilis]